MLFLNGSSIQSSSQALYTEQDAADGLYASSTFPVTAAGRSGTKWLTGPVTTMYILCFSVAGMAVLLNSVVLVAVMRYCRKPRPYTILVLNLCVADFVVSTTTIAVYSLQYVRLRAMENEIVWGTSLQANYCSQFAFGEIVWTAAFYGSLLTIATMSTYHLIALRWPHSKICLESEQCIAIVLVLTWSLALSLGLPQCFIIATSYHDKMDRCRTSDLPLFCCKLMIYRNRENQMGQELHKKIVYSIFAGVIIVVFVVILCIYSYLVTKSWIMHHVRMTNRKTQESPTAAELAWRRLVATTAMLVAAFCVFWLPHVAYMCLRAFEWLPDLSKALTQEHLQLLKAALHTLGCLCGIADPFIYCLRVPEVRTALEKAPVIRRVLFARKTSTKKDKADDSPKSTIDV